MRLVKPRREKYIKKSDFHSFTEEQRQEIMKEAPDDVFLLSKETQDKWVSAELADRALNECPDRFFVFQDKDGENQTVDLKQINVKGMILRKGGTMSDWEDAMEIKRAIIVPLLKEVAMRKSAYSVAYRIEHGANFSSELKEKLIRLFSEMNGVDGCQKIIKDEDGILLSAKELLRFFAKNKAEIEAKRAVFLANSNEFKIATEAGRLQILNSILEDLNIKYNHYMKLNKEDKALIFTREIRNILEQARKEIKGNELKLTVDGKIDITATLHGQENVAKILRSLPINAIVIGLVAAKSNLDPAVLIHQLATSYYKDFNGFNKNILGRDQITLPGDCIRAYDWGELRKENVKFLNEMRPPKVEEASYQDVTAKETLKARLERIKQENK